MDAPPNQHLKQLPMTLVMPLADPSPAGLRALGHDVFERFAGQLNPALDAGGVIHFARFVVVDGNLMMISEYDGQFEDYILGFVSSIGGVFDAILAHIADPPPTPVGSSPDEFVQWVRAHDQKVTAFYCGYPGLTVQEIRTAAGFNAPAAQAQSVSAAPSDPLPLDDIQGVILRGFGMSRVRHLVLRVADASAARVSLGRLVSGEAGLPQLTSATDRGSQKPPLCLALGITAAGLSALGLPADSLGSFPTDFREGAVGRAGRIGDAGASSPQFWAGGLDDTDNVHLVLSLYGDVDTAIEDAQAALGAAFGAAIEQRSQFDGQVFPGNPNGVHFGYRDNISQPQIAGGPPGPDDGQPLCPPGEFLLGHPSQYPGLTLDVPVPAALGTNGSFGVLRVLAQDVSGFEKFLREQGPAIGLDPEALAAKICGRWRNGVPLVLSPDTPDPQTAIPDAALNSFDYEPGDSDGTACPVGAHIRRANPRSQPMRPAGDNLRRRLIRRGIPYGPPIDPGDPSAGDDGVERGLLGLFIGASITLQFEAVMQDWLNQGLTSPQISGTSDALVGARMQGDGAMRIPAKSGDLVVSGIPGFVTTRGCAYLFLPSITAVRWIAALRPAALRPAAPTATGAAR